MSLNTKQEAFCKVYILSGSGADAYRSAYNVRPRTKQETVWQQASRILADPKVSARVDELRLAARIEAEWSAADRLQALKTIFDSHAEKDARVAISAIAEANKMQGSYAPQKWEHSGPNGGPIQTGDLTNETDDQLNALEAIVGPLAAASGDDEGEEHRNR